MKNYIKGFCTLLLLLTFSLGSCTVYHTEHKKDNGKHKGWYKAPKQHSKTKKSKHYSNGDHSNGHHKSKGKKSK